MIKKLFNRYIEKIINQIEIKYFYYHSSLIKKVDNYRKENQSLSGRIKILEEQQEIMHNFLVEINKYLFNLKEKENG